MKDYKTAILIKKLALEFDKVAIPVLKPHNVTPSQFKVLKYLLNNKDKDVRQKDIEVAYSMTNPTVTGILKNLERAHWIERVENSKDARSKVIKLTQKTLDKEDEFLELGEKLEEKFTKALSEEEEKQLKELLTKLLTNLEKE